MSWVLFILICYGITQIVIYGKIFNKFRPKAAFFHCSMCVGFWIGVMVGWLARFCPDMLGAVNMASSTIIGLVFCGCISSATSYCLDVLIGDNGLNLKR